MKIFILCALLIAELFSSESDLIGGVINSYDLKLLAIGVLTLIILIILIFNRKLQEQIRENEQAKAEVQKLNEALQKRVEKESREKNQQQKIMQQQSKMASMGEMMSAVAHQWKQPLNGISMYSDIFRSDFAEGNVDQAYIDNMMDDVNMLITQMTDTLTEFRSFFSPNKATEDINILHCIHSVLLLNKDELLNNQIEVKVDVNKRLFINAVENEFKYVLLSILNYQKEMFKINNRKKRTIIIQSKQKKNALSILLKDNAGGIDLRLIDELFKPDLDDDDNKSIGLFISKLIIENEMGSLDAYNCNEGTCFEIKLAFAKMKE